MSTQVSTTDLSRIVNAINDVRSTVYQIQNTTNHIQQEVNVVDNKVNVVNAELQDLKYQFVSFVKEQRNANNLQQALTEIVRVRQELEQKFGKHADARKRLQGILDTAETGLLREFTIASCSEQIMLDTPKYWLAPCLVALAAWISNDNPLTQKAVKVALDRDVEKATLLFALVSRRTVPQNAGNDMKAVKEARQQACFKWLDAYFKCQNPLKMKDSVIVVIDSWANDVFGADNGTCSETFKAWMTAVTKSIDNFAEKEQARWYNYFLNYNKSSQQEFPILAAVSPEFNAIDAYLQRINAAPRIQNYFDVIMAAKINKDDLINRLDEQLEMLITDFDIEEEDLRKEEEHYELVKQFKGDADLVKIEEQKRAKKKAAAYANLAERLSEAVRSKDSKYAAARKTALSTDFLGQYVKDAYAEYVADQKEAFPTEITIANKEWQGWSGKTTDGSNSTELVNSFKNHMNKCRDNDKSKVTDNNAKTKGIIAIILAVIGVVMLFVAAVVGVIALVAAVFFAVQWHKGRESKKQGLAKIDALYAQLIDKGVKIINAAIDQWLAVLQKVGKFENEAKFMALDLTAKETVVALEDDEPVEEEEAEEDSLDSLDDLAAETEAPAEEFEAEEETKDYSKSPEFLNQFAKNFSNEFVLVVPTGVNFAELKKMQDKKH